MGFFCAQNLACINQRKGLFQILRGLSSSSMVVFVIEMEVQFLKLQNHWRRNRYATQASELAGGDIISSGRSCQYEDII